ncbi:MAG TPA: DUF6155 family protein, partial [Syntrophales bacterium]|nr:DUF6155 family protein [Syntrophales bacterium]
MEKLSIRDLKKYLQELPSDNVIADIITLCKDIPEVRDYYFTKIYPGAEEVILEKYKKVIENEYFPARGFGNARSSIARKAISDFKKISKSPVNVVDLLFFHVSIGVDYTNEYGDIDDSFYTSLENSFEQALKFSFQHGINNAVKENAKTLCEKCQGFGWGFSDSIRGIYW